MFLKSISVNHVIKLVTDTSLYFQTANDIQGQTSKLNTRIYIRNIRDVLDFWKE